MVPDLRKNWRWAKVRPVYLYDLDAATRVVLAVPDADRFAVATALVHAADTADRYRKRLGKAHPSFGTGTLTSAASRLPRVPAVSCDAGYRACLELVLRALKYHSA